MKESPKEHKGLRDSIKTSGVNIIAKNGYLFAKKTKATDNKLASSVDNRGDVFSRVNTDD